MVHPTEVDRTTPHWGRPEAFLIVLLTWVAIYLPALGAPELRGEEGRRVLPAVTMLKTGDWLVPRVGGEPYYRKPPVINWLVAGSIALTGRQDDWSARLPSTLFVLAFAALLIWFPGDWPSTEARLIAAVIFLTSFGVIKKGRYIEIEAVYVSLTSMAMLTWIVLWIRDRSRWALWLVPCVFLTIGMLTKGPPILLFQYIPILCILAYSRRLRALLSAPHLLSVVLCLGIPALWAYLAWRQAVSSANVADQFSETIVRLTPAGINWSQWTTQAMRSFANPLPWLFFIPLLWMRDFVGRLPAAHLPLFKGARLGMVIAFLLITVIPGNSGRYSMPAIGLECILLGWVLAQVGQLPDDGRLWRRAILIGFAVAIVLALVGLAGIRTDLWTMVLLAAAVCLLVVLFRWQGFFRRPAHLAALSALLGAVLMLEYALFVPRMIQRDELRRPVAKALNSLLPDDEPLYTYRTGYLDFLFYINGPVEYLFDPGEIDGRVHYLLIRDPNDPKSKAEPTNAALSGRPLYLFTYRHYGTFQLVERKEETNHAKPGSL